LFLLILLMEDLVVKSKLLLIIIFSVLLFLSIPSKAFAADLTITCNGSSCRSNGGSLFNETNIAPGYSVTKTVLIDNSTNSDDCNLYLQATRVGSKPEIDLVDKIDTTIYTGSQIYFGPQPLAELLGQNLFLGVVSNGSSKEYSWGSSFNTDSGNEYQDSGVIFNFNINFTCGTAPTLTPTSVIPTPTPTSAFTLNNDAGGLSVLGVATENVNPSLNGVTPSVTITDGNTNIGNVLGTQCEASNNWWIVLVVQVILSVIALIIKGFKPSLSSFWLLLILLGILSQVAHNYWGCGCVTDYWCTNYLSLNLFGVLTGIFCYYLITLRGSIRSKV
jgi:hypothetical protein